VCYNFWDCPDFWDRDEFYDAQGNRKPEDQLPDVLFLVDYFDEVEKNRYS